MKIISYVGHSKKKRLTRPPKKAWSAKFIKGPGPSKPIVVDARNLSTIKGRPDDTILHAFKYTIGGRSPHYHSRRPILKVKRGARLAVRNADTSSESCGAGVNVATLRYCKDSADGWHDAQVWKVEFTPKDIASVPYNSGGKFRLFRCKVIGKVK